MPEAVALRDGTLCTHSICLFLNRVHMCRRSRSYSRSDSGNPLLDIGKVIAVEIKLSGIGEIIHIQGDAACFRAVYP